jgi:hypothetical protein
MGVHCTDDILGIWTDGDGDTNSNDSTFKIVVYSVEKSTQRGYSLRKMSSFAF